jgi:hypothetical protein
MVKALKVDATRHLFRASAALAALFKVQIRCLNMLIFDFVGFNVHFPSP